MTNEIQYHPYFEQRIPLMIELGFRKEALPQLMGYINLLWSTNEELNLISRKMTFEELIDNHLIDCLLPLRHFPSALKVVADFGSGGGLPGVLYAIQFPQTQFQLFEKSKLKRDFLTLCKRFAANIEVLGDIPLALDKVDLVMARAFKPLDVILDMSRSYYSRNLKSESASEGTQTKYFLLKARKEKIDEEVSLALKKFKDLKVRVVELNSPVLEVERHLVLVDA